MEQSSDADTCRPHTTFFLKFHSTLAIIDCWRRGREQWGGRFEKCFTSVPFADYISKPFSEGAGGTSDIQRLKAKISSNSVGTVVNWLLALADSLGCLVSKRTELMIALSNHQARSDTGWLGFFFGSMRLSPLERLELENSGL